MNDMTKTSFYVTIDIPIHLFEKKTYNKLIKINLLETAQYIIYYSKTMKYFHYYNDYFNKTYQYKQLLMMIIFQN